MFVGGGLGAVARAIPVALFPADASSWVVLAINLTGSFIFAWLATAFLKRHRTILLFFGTGFLGGFTTYSTLSFDLASRLVGGDLLGAGLLALLSLAGGIALARMGWMLGSMGRGGSRPADGSPHDSRNGPPDNPPPTVPGGTAVAP